MSDRTHDDVGAKVRAIIDDTLAELLMLGTDGPVQAAKLMACQAIVRIHEPEVIAEVADFAESFIERGASA
jgi:hypothetical protein